MKNLIPVSKNVLKINIIKKIERLNNNYYGNINNNIIQIKQIIIKL